VTRRRTPAGARAVTVDPAVSEANDRIQADVDQNCPDVPGTVPSQ
jgi:hypothetical protein